MLEIEELKEIAKYSNFNIGQLEKSIYQDIILFILYKKYAQELVFKGGTALTKCYALDRFSEDLDFTMDGDFNENYLYLGLEHFGIKYNASESKKEKSHKIMLKINGPLFNNEVPMSVCSIRLDISTREKVDLKPNIVKIKSQTNTIPQFDIVVMKKEEIFAEKIRAIFSRKQARDLYDLYFLNENKPSLTLINKKLSYYNFKFSKSVYKERIELINPIWDKEMKHLVKSYPNFKDIKKRLQNYF